MDPASPQAPKAADADLLGEAATLKRPAAPEGADAVPAAGGTAGDENFQQPRPAEDENQPGFIGERNLPHP
jgi:hypothetical protein